MTMRRYSNLHRQHPQRELCFVHTEMPEPGAVGINGPDRALPGGARLYERAVGDQEPDPALLPPRVLGVGLGSEAIDRLAVAGCVNCGYS
jgi:hypothetical protein